MIKPLTQSKYDEARPQWASDVYEPLKSPLNKIQENIYMGNSTYQTELDELSKEVKKMVHKAHVEARETSDDISERVNTELQDLTTLMKIDTSKMTRSEMEAYATQSLENIRHTLKHIEHEIYLWPKIKKWFNRVKYGTWGAWCIGGTVASTLFFINHMLHFGPEHVGAGYAFLGIIVSVVSIIGFTVGAAALFNQQSVENALDEIENNGLCVTYDDCDYVIYEHEIAHRKFVYVPLKLVNNQYVPYNKKNEHWEAGAGDIVRRHLKFNSQKNAVKFIKTGSMQYCIKK